MSKQSENEFDRDAHAPDDLSLVDADARKRLERQEADLTKRILPKIGVRALKPLGPILGSTRWLIALVITFIPIL